MNERSLRYCEFLRVENKCEKVPNCQRACNVTSKGFMGIFICIYSARTWLAMSKAQVQSFAGLGPPHRGCEFMYVDGSMFQGTFKLLRTYVHLNGIWCAAAVHMLYRMPIRVSRTIYRSARCAREAALNRDSTLGFEVKLFDIHSTTCFQ